MSKYFIKLLLLFIPALLVFQHYFITEIQYLLIAVRYILIPLWIFFNIKKSADIRWLVIGFIYFSFILLFSYEIEGKPYILYLNIVSSACYFSFGSNLILQNKYNLLRFLRYGVDVINISTIVVYNLAILNIYDAVSYFRDEFFLVNGYENLYDRFSFGNPIEVAFMITALLYIVMLSNPSKQFSLSVTLNLITALISGSRIVIILAFILLVIELGKMSFKHRFRLSFFIILFSIFFTNSFEFIFESTDLSYLRFAGASESGSMIDRLSIYTAFYEIFPRLDTVKMLFGDGFNSSYSFVKNHVGGFRTSESILIQLILETGLIGAFILLPKVLLSSFRFKLLSLKGFSVFVIFIQLLFFLPIFTFMHIIFLLLGFISNPSLNKTQSV
jgi:hypothetical protein